MFKKDIFQVPGPTCSKCHDASLDFTLYQRVPDSVDSCFIIKWFCSSDECNYSHEMDPFCATDRHYLGSEEI